MRIGSSSDIYSLLVPRAKTKDNNDGPSEPANSLVGGSGSGLGRTSIGNDEAAAAFLARLAKSGFERDDTNGDGIVERQEYIDRAMENRPDGYQPDLADVQNTWNQLDKDGTGSLTEQDYASGISSVFQVASGSFSKPLR
ncbi:EF-hand domain-containing protein [Endobacterium cereale]|uniref:hypothetical protein n=1 Tax=Endobacterium cereale TaxID=2663029 RepID=UPI002B45FABD|nr:hypothetical protein [Endobacterium cereale]MEB2848040.1 hypothetical protein [Endobacterium cereale]